MKTIYKIAKSELSMLFYSPIAWLILVIFIFQVGMDYADLLSKELRYKATGYSLLDVTADIFSGMWGLYSSIQEYLYLYIPLLTMGIMSREFSTGSIKLLFSSPITNMQIVLGKFYALMVYAFLLLGGLMLIILFNCAVIKSIDLPLVLSGLLGLYLLTCAYIAIGLFMSSLTSYQVVAAMGTLAVLALLNFIGGVGQEIALVRDITYWLSISGRSREMIDGLICSEDVLYFLIVITLFVVLTILRLRFNRKKGSQICRIGWYTLVVG
ncbi:MAG: ABC transporter permease, partial [Odoribacter sp.]|nr:ABC transporter permease [Odoribacter sp.]